MHPLLSCLVMLLPSEWKCLLLGGSRLPSEQLKPSSPSTTASSSSSSRPLLSPQDCHIPSNHLTTLPSDSQDGSSRAHVHASVCTRICERALGRRGGVEAVLLMLHLCRQTVTERARAARGEAEAIVALTTVAVLCTCLCVRSHFTKRLDNVSDLTAETRSWTEAEGLRPSPLSALCCSTSLNVQQKSTHLQCFVFLNQEVV